MNGKICNFDCIYCECGRNEDGRGDTRIPSRDEVKKALAFKLKECLEAGTPIDSITFSGDGEPTLNPEFPGIIDDTLSLRNEYYPSAKVSVLSNATRLGDDAVFEALRKVDNPIMKIDACSNELAGIINRPHRGYDVRDVIDNLLKFKGDFVLQTMFLKSGAFDSSTPEVLESWMDVVRRLSPREVMVYTIDRPVPEDGLHKFSEEQMRSFVRPLLEEGYNIQIKA